MKDEKGSKWSIKLCETIQRSFDVTHISTMLKFQYKIFTVFPQTPINVKEVHSCFSQLRFLFQEDSTQKISKKLLSGSFIIYLPFIFNIFLHKASLFPNQVVKIRRIRHSQKSSGSLGDNTPFAAKVSKGRELNG